VICLIDFNFENGFKEKKTEVAKDKVDLIDFNWRKRILNMIKIDWNLVKKRWGITWLKIKVCLEKEIFWVFEYLNVLWFYIFFYLKSKNIKRDKIK